MSNYDLGLYSTSQRLLSQLGQEGAAIIGPLKAAQQFASLFLTEQGSVTYKPNYGTDFIYYFRFSIIRTDGDVIMYFNQASADVIDYLNGIHDTYTDTTPDDELITNIELENFTLESQQLLLYVTLTMKSGDVTSVVLPITAGVEVTDGN